MKSDNFLEILRDAGWLGYGIRDPEECLSLWREYYSPILNSALQFCSLFEGLQIRSKNGKIERLDDFNFDDRDSIRHYCNSGGIILNFDLLNAVENFDSEEKVPSLFQLVLKKDVAPIGEIEFFGTHLYIFIDLDGKIYEGMPGYIGPISSESYDAIFKLINRNTPYRRGEIYEGESKIIFNTRDYLSDW